MKHRIIPLFLLIVLFLGACGAGPDSDELALELRTRLISTSSVTAEATLRADYDEYVCDFTLSLAADPESATVTVLSPESIAGISATVDSGSAVLRFNGAELTTGEVYTRGVTPVEALPAMLESWKNAYISESLLETTDGEELLRISFDAEGGAQHLLWCSAETLTPLRAEIISGGRCVISCVFESFIIQ